MNVKFGKFYIRTRVIVIPHHVRYRTLEVKWLSAQQFNTLHKMPEQILFAYRDFST
jgi:hypothetical protein